MAEDRALIAAVVLAAGRAKRMGRSKLDLPMPGGGTVISRLLDALRAGGAAPIVVVTGAHRHAVMRAAAGEHVRFEYNRRFNRRGMLGSVKAGLRALKGDQAEAAFIVPGDHPFILPETIVQMAEIWVNERPAILIPSDGERRGHPLLLRRDLWAPVCALRMGRTLRMFLSDHEADIRYLVVDDPGILRDIDHPEEYRRLLEAARRPPADAR